MFILASELERTSDLAEKAGLYPTLAAVSVGVFVLAFLIRAVENYIRHLHKKPYLPYANPRFIVSTIGFILVTDGFVIGGIFSQRLPLGTATMTISAGLVCLIASLVMWVIPAVRELRHLREHREPGDATREDSTGGGGVGSGGVSD